MITIEQKLEKDFLECLKIHQEKDLFFPTWDILMNDLIHIKMGVEDYVFLKEDLFKRGMIDTKQTKGQRTFDQDIHLGPSITSKGFSYLQILQHEERLYEMDYALKKSNMDLNDSIIKNNKSVIRLTIVNLLFIIAAFTISFLNYKQETKPRHTVFIMPPRLQELINTSMRNQNNLLERQTTQKDTSHSNSK